MNSGTKIDIHELNASVADLKRECSSLAEKETLTELRQLFTCIDNTTLNGSDTPSSVYEFCENTKNTMVPSPDGPLQVAAVCVYPSFVTLAKKQLNDTPIRVASVAGGFPAGQIPIYLKMQEVRYVVDNGADEVDFVINRGLFLSGETNAVFDEIAAAKENCGKNSLLKVIIECGELLTLQNIYDASFLALCAGADFVKTSTGKIPVGATPESAYAMMLALHDFREKNKKTVGFKVAGGVSNHNDAILYGLMYKKIFDVKNINNQIFRIGTSRLTAQLHKLLTL
ncbi:MAG: deoxyribose-phosphate aldolase [Bacteroidales bacterium]|nr:deoxyribose-phosphate aldolase [Bacteroidales bacterium]